MTDLDATQLFLLLESYILDAVGQLPKDDAEILEQITEKLKNKPGEAADSWQGVVELGLAEAGKLEGFKAGLQQAWAAHVEGAEEAHQKPDPSAFVEAAIHNLMT